MKKHHYKIAAVLSLLLLALGTTSALALTASTEPEQTKGIEARADRTEWKYARIDGAYHKRLWSNTYGRWLTDWIPC